MLEEFAFISFLSFYILYGLVIILYLTDESQELGQTFSVYCTTTYSGLTKVNDLICYSQTKSAKRDESYLSTVPYLCIYYLNYTVYSYII